MEHAEYQKYLASRKWYEKRGAVKHRARGWCERCRARRMRAVHHLTYENVGNEPLEDLQAVCQPCHDFVHAQRGSDPAKGFVASFGTMRRGIAIASDVIFLSFFVLVSGFLLSFILLQLAPWWHS